MEIQWMMMDVVPNVNNNGDGHAHQEVMEDLQFVSEELKMVAEMES